MNIRLNQRCRIEQKTVTQDIEYGTDAIVWSLVAVVWCEVQDVLPSRAESQDRNIDLSRNPARWRARHRTDIDSSMRIIIDGTIYQIISGPASINNKMSIECMIERHSS